MWGDMGMGYQAGKEQALSDWNAGRTISSECPYTGVSSSYILGYTAGYNTLDTIHVGAMV
jgi:hypothetical protein